ncbi:MULTISPECIES: DUF1028 domain-containing protein [Thalassobaculum]|uniref:Uncharacterized conserved protein, Ntn-hydrolase superfamily n=1 Tax=Thalassobaculum litoreum DSM 18839 TaxID=1123362 RepID=A0A8G2BJN2_9PROT|nr:MULTISPECIES: DUF1028 domain-containing protein [Thalassobaculum]SDG08727.1 Uncharacterized conserved protein, Ntn-hydrolase superfamily [Thalassobaculum litoreum DSM 18839]
MTFSLTARCEITGAFGMVVSSSSTAVAARCAFARAGVGAVATQNITDPRIGPRGLDLLETGLPARTVLERIVESTEHIAYRQIALIDSQGGTAAYSGANTLGTYASAEGRGCVAAGNMLAGEGVVAAMVDAFESRSGRSFGKRLIRSLQAGLAAGGEAGPVHSAGLLIQAEVSWPVADLRVDYSDTPIADLTALWELWKPDMDSYVTRALDPSKAPSYGVPGDP